MTRSTTILAVFQILCIVVGFTTLGIVLKMSGYPDDSTVRWNPLAVVLREKGFLLLILPLAWVIFSIYSNYKNSGIFRTKVSYILGVAVALIPIVIFIYAAIKPFTRPIFYK